MRLDTSVNKLNYTKVPCIHHKRGVKGSISSRDGNEESWVSSCASNRENFKTEKSQYICCHTIFVKEQVDSSWCQEMYNILFYIIIDDGYKLTYLGYDFLALSVYILYHNSGLL